MRLKVIQKMGLWSLLVLTFSLSGYVISPDTQRIVEEEAGSVMVAQLNNRGVEFYHQGKLPEALGSFITASQMDETIWEPHFNCAVTLVAMGRVDEAVRHLKLSIDIKSDNPLALEFFEGLLGKVSPIV